VVLFCLTSYPTTQYLSLIELISNTSHDLQTKSIILLPKPEFATHGVVEGPWDDGHINENHNDTLKAPVWIVYDEWHVPKIKFILGHCVACFHNGGPVGTALSLAAGVPSVVLPMFGEEEFWGEILGQAGVASTKQLNLINVLKSEKLKISLQQVLQANTRKKSSELARHVNLQGTANAIKVLESAIASKNYPTFPKHSLVYNWLWTGIKLGCWLGYVYLLTKTVHTEY